MTLKIVASVYQDKDVCKFLGGVQFQIKRQNQSHPTLLKYVLQVSQQAIVQRVSILMAQSYQSSSDTAVLQKPHQISSTYHERERNVRQEWGHKDLSGCFAIEDIVTQCKTAHENETHFKTAFHNVRQCKTA